MLRILNIIQNTYDYTNQIFKGIAYRLPIELYAFQVQLSDQIGEQKD